MENLLWQEKLAIKELVDTFSIMADDKDVVGQTALFTENAVVKSYLGGQPISELSGRDQIGSGFGAFLANFETVYHINGQQVVTVDGDKAKGTSYCQVVLIGDVEGKKIRTMQGVRYQDEYVKKDGKWLIAARNSYFVWRESSEVAE